MRVAIIVNQGHARIRAFAKRAVAVGHEIMRGRVALPSVLPEYNGIAHLLDPDPLLIEATGNIDWDSLAKCDLLIWEWGWTSNPPARLLEIRKRVSIRTLVFPGPLDRFWREVESRDLALHFRAIANTDLIGVMLADMVPFYQDLAPHAKVIHLPVPVDVDVISRRALAAAERKGGQILLTAPTAVTGRASQMAVTTFAAFRAVVAQHPELKGIAYTYESSEKRDAAELLDLLQLTKSVELRPYARPLQRFLDQIRDCRAGMLLTNGNIQGRTAMMAACLGIPMVVSDHIETHRRLFPETSVPWFDTTAAANRMRRLLTDEAFCRQVVTHASTAIHAYAPAVVRQRILDSLVEVG